MYNKNFFIFVNDSPKRLARTWPNNTSVQEPISIIENYLTCTVGRDSSSIIVTRSRRIDKTVEYPDIPQNRVCCRQ